MQGINKEKEIKQKDSRLFNKELLEELLKKRQNEIDEIEYHLTKLSDDTLFLLMHMHIREFKRRWYEKPLTHR